MNLDVVVPATRQLETERLVASLALGEYRPRRVLLVSNEIEPFDPHGLDVRLLRFSSEAYCYGDQDVALRQNIGIFWSDAEDVCISGDDQLAPVSMLSDVMAALGAAQYVWGNHRKLSFSDHGNDPVAINALPFFAGISRENPEPPARHGWQSCYGGMFASHRDFLVRRGAFDMTFNCRHAGEDQQLGRRLAHERGEGFVWIAAWPYSWMNLDPKTPFGPITETNSCHRHGPDEIMMEHRHGLATRVCPRCPWRQVPQEERAIYEPVLRERFDPALVTVTEVRFDASPVRRAVHRDGLDVQPDVSDVPAPELPV